MESVRSMLNAQMILMIYILTGIYCQKKGLITEKNRIGYIDLILKVTLPCMIFNSFNKPLTPEILRQTAMALFAASAVAAVSLLIGNIAYRNYPPARAGILKYCTLVNNAGFLGMPLVQSVFGDDGLLFASIYVLPTRILMWTAGISLFTEADFRTRARNILLNPCIVTVYLGLARRILNIPLPAFIDTAIAKIGGVTSPLSMMVIGSMLVGVDWRKMVEKDILYFSAIRLVLLPCIAFLMGRLLHFDTLLTGVCMVMTGMPAGSTGALLAAKYGADEEFASRVVVSSTVLSLVTAPVLMVLL